MAEAAFSEDGKYYSAITQDGRLKIWDTERNVLKQEYTADLHLTAPPTCLQWIRVTLNSGPKNGVRRKSISEIETHCVALGTTNGKVLLYSLSQAKIETVLTNTDSNKIQSLDWHKKYGLFSCTANNIVYEWDLQESKVKCSYNVNVSSNIKQGNKVSAIRIVPHNQKTPAKFLITASYQIALWKLHDSNATVVKLLGHNAAPRALLTIATLENSCWLIEGAQTERLLSFWNITITPDDTPQQNGEEITPSKRQRKKSINAPVVPTPEYNFVLEDAPKIIDVDIKDDGETKLSLVASTRSGVVHYYAHSLNGQSTKPIKPSITIQVTTQDAQPLPLQCCRLNDDSVLLGYSNGPTLLFEKIQPDTKTKTQVLIRGSGKEKAKKEQNDMNKIKETIENGVTYIEPMGGVSRKRTTPGGKVEVSMEARLENLTVDIKSRSKAPVNQNLTKLLMQGLHSKDKELILTVLQQNSEQVALRSVASLPADYLPLLLEQLAEMARRKTSQCAAVCTWVSAILRCHSALLLATLNSKTSDHLAPLFAIFTNRRSHLCQLLNLKGRIELTVSQRTTSDVLEQKPVLHYCDSSSDEEMEVEKYQSGSEQSWEDDESPNQSDSD